MGMENPYDLSNSTSGYQNWGTILAGMGGKPVLPSLVAGPPVSSMPPGAIAGNPAPVVVPSSAAAGSPTLVPFPVVFQSPPPMMPPSMGGSSPVSVVSSSPQGNPASTAGKSCKGGCGGNKSRANGKRPSSQIVVFAKNQVLQNFAGSGVQVTVTTDPVSLANFDRATAVGVLNALWGGTARQVTMQCQTSNDGVTWLNDGPTVGFFAANAAPSRITANVNGAFLRFVFMFDITAGAGDGAADFDLSCLLDHK